MSQSPGELAPVSDEESDAATLVDLERYPLEGPDAPAYHEALVRGRAGLTSQGCAVLPDRKSTRLNSSHSQQSRMPSSA